MTELHTVVFRPEIGETVELPENVGRIDVDRVGSPEIGFATLKIGVVGEGDLEEYVVLESHADSTEVESGSQILAVDVARDRLLYALSASAYGGEA